MKSYYSQAMQKAKELGATVDKHTGESDIKRVHIDAPDGFIWGDSGASCLVVDWNPEWKESKEEAFKYALERMNGGLELEE